MYFFTAPVCIRGYCCPCLHQGLMLPMCAVLHGLMLSWISISHNCWGCIFRDTHSLLFLPEMASKHAEQTYKETKTCEIQRRDLACIDPEARRDPSWSRVCSSLLFSKVLLAGYFTETHVIEHHSVYSLHNRKIQDETAASDASL